MTESAILRQYWGHESFRPLQLEIIQAVLQGKDTLALLPTGGGKSICFQVPAMAMEGICIVVSPLIALMKDQVENLNARGIKAVAIYAGMGKREIDILLDNCIYGPVKFLYLSPERLLADLVKTRISYMKVNLVAVDEAHCISQWGYDFRPPYQQIASLREIHPQVPVIALTATATRFVRSDIVEKLKMSDPQIFVQSFVRKNLSYVVYDLEDKYKKMLQIIRQVRGTGLIYVRNRRETTEVALFLQRNQITADFYHAGLEKNERSKRQDLWKKNQLRVIVATNAFGMGIDKPDVRFVIHLDLPESLEAYYQEAGRAGRDGKRAYAVLLANQADRDLLRIRYTDSFPEVAEIKKIYHHLGSYFQLAYGAGEGIFFNFDLADFCKRYQLGVIKTLSALKFLEHDGYLTLSENIFLPSRVLFLAGNEDVYRFQIENQGYDPLIKTILRSYGGMFDHYAQIQEAELAKRLGISWNDVVRQLQNLEDQGLISYLRQSDQPQLQFTRARVDQIHLDTDTVYIQFRKKIQEEQIAAVLAYSTNWTCRTIQLLEYFDEAGAAPCGMCDVCLAEIRNQDQAELQDKIKFEIITLLKNKLSSLDELIPQLSTGTDQDKLNQLRSLLDEGKIKSDGKNYYI